MAGGVAAEGLVVMGDLVFKGSNADRGTTLQLGLFTNSVNLAALKALALTSITEPTGGSYARKTLTDASWVNTDGVLTYPLQTFTAGSGGYSGQVYGYFIATTGTTPRLLAVEIDPAGPYTMNAGDPYNIYLTANWL